MPIPTKAAIYPRLLSIVAARALSRREIVDQLADAFGVTAEERAIVVPSGGRQFDSRVNFAIKDLKSAGLVHQPDRSFVEATQLGRTFLGPPPRTLNEGLLRRLAVESTDQTPRLQIDSAGPREPIDPHGPSAAERLDSTALELAAALQADLLAAIRGMSPAAFERLILKLLSKLGYGLNAIRTGGAGDEGLDGVVHHDHLGLDRIYIQAKRYGEDNPIGPGKVREFVGALTNAGATKGVLVTSSRFTQAALAALPQGNNAARIVLIDGDELARLMASFEVGVRTVGTIRVQKLDLAPFDEDDET